MAEARSSVVAPPGFFDPFSPAEAAAKDAIDAIVSRGGKMLYDANMERRSYPFSVETTSQQLVAELRMCYVPCDPGEDRLQPCRRTAPELDGADADGVGAELDGWALEPEPARIRIDTWARAVVPVRKRIVPRQEADQPKTGRRQNANHLGVTSSRPSSRAGVMTATRSMPTRSVTGSVAPSPVSAAATDRDDKGAGGERRESSTHQPIPLECEQEEDEEEMRIREMKERETKRKADDEVRVKKKVAEDSQEAARLAQLQDQMKSKPFTYDSSGNIVWVQPVEVNRLPNQTQPMSFSVKVDRHHQEASAPSPRVRSTSPHASPRAASLKKRGKPSKSFTDNYKKNVTVQPSVFDNIVLSPGVELSNRSGKHKGQARGRDPGQPMSRKEYDDMVRIQSGPEGYPDKAERGRARAPSAPPGVPVAVPAAAMAQDMLGSAAPANRPEAAPAVVAAQEVPRVPMVARPPETPRPQQPAPPPSFRRLKNGALGHLGTSARERTSNVKGSRFPNCPPAPPLGATMGHGLMKSGSKDFYFPSGEERSASLSARDAPARRPELGPLSARTPRRAGSPGGSIMSRKPDFLGRHFPSQ